MAAWGGELLNYVNMVVKQFRIYRQKSGISYQKIFKKTEFIQDFKNKIKL